MNRAMPVITMAQTARDRAREDRSAPSGPGPSTAVPEPAEASAMVAVGGGWRSPSAAVVGLGRARPRAAVLGRSGPATDGRGPARPDGAPPG